MGQEKSKHWQVSLICMTSFCIVMHGKSALVIVQPSISALVRTGIAVALSNTKLCTSCPRLQPASLQPRTELIWNILGWAKRHLQGNIQINQMIIVKCLKAHCPVGAQEGWRGSPGGSPILEGEDWLLFHTAAAARKQGPVFLKGLWTPRQTFWEVQGYSYG